MLHQSRKKNSRDLLEQEKIVVDVVVNVYFKFVYMVSDCVFKYRFKVSSVFGNILICFSFRGMMS